LLKVEPTTINNKLPPPGKHPFVGHDVAPKRQTEMAA
jgi:hypothetical protein